MSESERLQTARASYGAYESGDRDVLEEIISDDFEFFAPTDPGIDRATYFERCWPNADHLEKFEYVRLIENGDEVFVTYETTKTDGKRFRNTEVLTFAGEKICKAEVYFGWDIE
jgi:ketosteroid isomerase-like protein